jgi:hypothetical protein
MYIQTPMVIDVSEVIYVNLQRTQLENSCPLLQYNFPLPLLFILTSHSCGGIVKQTKNESGNYGSEFALQKARYSTRVAVGFDLRTSQGAAD